REREKIERERERLERERERLERLQEEVEQRLERQEERIAQLEEELEDREEALEEAAEGLEVGGAAGIGEVLDVVSDRIPRILRGIQESVYSADHLKTAAESFATFYRTLIDSGMPDGLAADVTQHHLKNLLDQTQVRTKSRGPHASGSAHSGFDPLRGDFDPLGKDFDPFSSRRGPGPRPPQPPQPHGPGEDS
ncbi:MAG: hypothetical protein AB1778_09295, partial [Candidatus Bipolaricaulota bacterium]